MCLVYQWSSWKVPEAFIWNAINYSGLFNFKEFINFYDIILACEEAVVYGF
jgi:hypothetical protein